MASGDGIDSIELESTVSNSNNRNAEISSAARTSDDNGNFILLPDLIYRTESLRSRVSELPVPPRSLWCHYALTISSGEYVT